jgi:hypothetical protein
MSLCLRRGIIAYNRGHPPPGALRLPNGSATQACTLEAMRTQGAIFFVSRIRQK